MKQKLYLIAAGLIAFCLSACNGDDPITAPTAASTDTTIQFPTSTGDGLSPTVVGTQPATEDIPSDSAETAGSTEETSAAHTHSFGPWETAVEATCTSEGLLQRACSCGELETATVAMKEHSIRDGVCEFCGVVSNNALVFTRNEDGYSFSGLGTYSGSELIIPATFGGKPVTEISAGALRGCGHLTSISIPDSVTAIGADAFYGCSGLKTLVIPSQVTAIGFSALGECIGLESLSLPITGDSFGSLFGEFEGVHSVPSSLKNLTLNGGTAIADQAFQNCIHLETVTIGHGCTTIGTGAFSGCSGLKEIHLPDSLETVQADAFLGCTALRGVYITDIGPWCNIAFDNASSNPLYNGHNLYLNDEPVTGIAIPDGVTAIGDYAFTGCSATKLTVSDSVLCLGIHSFSNCTALIEIHLGQNVVSLGRSAFSGCTQLKTLHIDSSLRSIGNSAFAYCKDLTQIYFQGTVSQWEAIEKGNFWRYEAGKFDILYTPS